MLLKTKKEPIVCRTVPITGLHYLCSTHQPFSSNQMFENHWFWQSQVTSNHKRPPKPLMIYMNDYQVVLGTGHKGLHPIVYGGLAVTVFLACITSRSHYPLSALTKSRFKSAMKSFPNSCKLDQEKSRLHWLPWCCWSSCTHHPKVYACIAGAAGEVTLFLLETTVEVGLCTPLQSSFLLWTMRQGLAKCLATSVKNSL